MRLLLLALALAALPAAAQDAPARSEREIVITIDSTDRAVRFVRPDGDVLFFHGEPGDGRRTFGFDRGVRIERPFGTPGERVMIRRFTRDGEAGADTIRFEVPDVSHLLDRLPREGRFEWNRDGTPFQLFLGEPGVSTETRDRMRDLERRSRDLAREARTASGSERTRLERELVGILGELFEVRADARRERAAYLREQAERFQADAREIEDSLRERDAQRRELIDARRRELLGERDAADW